MRSMTSYLLLMFMVMFWIFRVIVAITASLGIDIGFAPMNMNIEIILLFVTLVSIGLVGKRKLLGAIIYVASYSLYFGVDLYHIVMGIMAGSTTLTDYSGAMASFIAVALSFTVFFNLLIDKNRTNHPVDKKTDCFIKTNNMIVN